MEEQKNFKLDFIGIGVEKSGTTWLAQTLREHPEVQLPERKELHFFNDKVTHDLNIDNNNYENLGFEWYHQHFDFNKKNVKRGEFTPSYISSSVAAKRIFQYNKNIKIICIFRNPLERLVSQYEHEKRLGLLSKKIGFEDIFKKKKNYLNKGLYSKNLKPYLELFSKKNILFLFYEEIKRYPRKLSKKVFNFLDIDSNFAPSSLLKQINIRGEAKYPIINHYIYCKEIFKKKSL